MNCWQKFFLAVGIRNTEAWLKTQPTLPDNSTVAVAETLGSKTTRSALLYVLLDLGHFVASLHQGTITLDQLVNHIGTLIGAASVLFLRHAISKHPEYVQQIREAAAKIPPALLIIGLTFFYTPTDTWGADPSTGGSATTAASPTQTAAESPNQNTVAVTQVTAPITSAFLLTDKFDAVGNPFAFLGAMSDCARFSGVYTWSPKTKLTGGGVAAMLEVATFYPGKAFELTIGPAYILGGSDAGFYSAAELALEAQLQATWIDNFWKSTPLLKSIPVAWSTSKAFLGGGYEFGGGKGSPCLSAGLSVSFGK